MYIANVIKARVETWGEILTVQRYSRLDAAIGGTGRSLHAMTTAGVFTPGVDVDRRRSATRARAGESNVAHRLESLGWGSTFVSELQTGTARDT